MNGTASTIVGSEASRLIIIRGNSGSGKSSLAKAIRAARPRGVAIIGQDILRREILHVRDHPGALSVPYIDMSARFALDHGLHVIVEGILYSEIYGSMLARLRADHRDVTRSYCYELELDETLRRHRNKPLANEVTEEVVASWYRSVDRVPELDEAVLGADVSASDALERVLGDVDWRTLEAAPRSSEAE